MERTTVAQIYKDKESFGGKQVTVCGWARSIRASNAFGFIELNDGSYFSNVQVVFEADKLENYTEIAKQNVGAALVVTGTLELTPEAKQPFEIKAGSIAVEGASTPDFPIQKKRHTLEFLRTIPHLRPRTNLYSAVFRVRSEAAFALHEFFHSRGFVYVHTPIITTSDAEGAGEMFRVTSLDLDNLPKTEDGKVDYTEDFFGKASSLTVSGQLNVEAFAQVYSNVYTFGPTFRAERSNTARHAAEFWMIEPEMAFCDLWGDMEVAEAMTKHVIRHVMKNCSAELDFFNKFIDTTLIERLTNVVENDFARVSYTDAIKILEENADKFEFKPYWGCDIQTEHERYLSETVFGRPVFVYNYPKEIKAFYMRLNDDGKTVAAADMLVPGIGELIGGSQREERLDYLEAAYKRCGLDEEDYWWYTELRKYGGTHHSGFGIGFERLIMFVTGVANIRDVLPFPRTTGSAEL
ncbi:MAG: asparagine--tRNA ligase [Clostridia bacterium]|nr:asparagine--tRNA ligase [Clostridia bacterium]